MTDGERPSPSTQARGLSLGVTNLTKLAGLALGVHEGFGDTPDVRVMAFAAFAMAGAQVSEGVLLALVDRFLGASQTPK